MNFERSLIIIAILLILGASAGFYYAERLFSDDDSALAAESLGKAEQIQNAANVRRRRYGSFDWKGLQNEEDVFFKDAIFVGADSELVLRLNDDTEMKIGQNSLLVLNIRKSSAAGPAVTELQLVQGQVSVDSSKTKAATEGTYRKFQIVLNKNVRIDIDKDSSLALTKDKQRTSLAVGKGSANMSVDGTSRGSQNVTLRADDKSTVIANLDLNRTETLAESFEKKKVESVKPLPGKKLMDLLSEKEEAAVKSAGNLEGLKNLVLEEEEQELNKVVEEFRQKELNEKPLPIPTPKPPPTPLPTPTAKPVVRPIIKPIVIVKPRLIQKKAVYAGLESRLRLLGPSDTVPQDYTRVLNTVEFSWEVEQISPAYFLIQVSTDKSFSKYISQMRVDLVDAKAKIGAIQQFTSSVSPIYFIYVPDLLRAVTIDKKFYWRVSPYTAKDQPIFEENQLPSSSVLFSISRKTVVQYNKDLIYQHSRKMKQPALNFTFRVQDILPSEYEIRIFSEDTYANVICKKSLTKFETKELKDLPALAKVVTIDLLFEEHIEIDPNKDCQIADLLKNETKLFFEILPKDMLGKAFFTDPTARGILKPAP